MFSVSLKIELNFKLVVFLLNLLVLLPLFMLQQYVPGNHYLFTFASVYKRKIITNNRQQEDLQNKAGL